MSVSGGKSSSRGKETTYEEMTPTYQGYTQDIMNYLPQDLGRFWQEQMEARMASTAPYGMTPEEYAAWKSTSEAAGAYGPTGPYGEYAGHIDPSLGAGWMAQMDPYFQAERKHIEGAMPAEEKAFMRDLQRQFGPAWGTHGRALSGAAGAYSDFRAQQAQRLADLEARRGQAAAAGAQWTGQMAPQVAQMKDPYPWGQQQYAWSQMPWTGTAQAIFPWSTTMADTAEMGYQYPVSTKQVGLTRTKEKTGGFSGGASY